jgi:hypothetical protein
MHFSCAADQPKALQARPEVFMQRGEPFFPTEGAGLYHAIGINIEEFPA